MMHFWWSSDPQPTPWNSWDTASLIVTISAFLDWMPRIAAFLAVIVWGLRIAQDPMVKRWIERLKKWRNK